MKNLIRLVASAMLVFVVVACASDPDTADEAGAEESQVATEESGSESVAETQLVGPLQGAGVATFVTRAGSSFSDGAVVELPTGGPPAGQLVPVSSRSDVTLYITRDGSVPSASNNWGGAIAPGRTFTISRPLEGTATYRVIGQLDGEYSDPFTVTVLWTHEESISLPAPVFRVNDSVVTGSVEISVSNDDDESARLQITSEYAAAMLYITRDGSDPSVDNFWASQRADGTYLYSPEPTSAEYRVIAIWQGNQSPVQSLSVDWVE